MKQRRNDFIFAASMLNDDGGNAEQMADIRLALTLPALVQMQFCGVTKRFHKTVCEQRLCDSGLFAAQFFCLSAAHLAEQAENFQIEPDECDHQAERAVPLHILRRSALNTAFDHVKIEDQI
jgi:hypothetical protein